MNAQIYQCIERRSVQPTAPTAIRHLYSVDFTEALLGQSEPARACQTDAGKDGRKIA